VAIVAGGRLVAVDNLSDVRAFQVRGWEVVVSDLTDASLQAATAAGHVVRATRLSNGRFALELPADVAPEQRLPALTAQGARIVSLHPLRDTLEEIFMRQVQAAEARQGTEHV
jgi:hypothetical protein